MSNTGSNINGNLVLGIDASNLRAGGGVTHITELLRVAQPEQEGFSAIHVWGNQSTLERLPERPWLQKVTIPALDGNALQRVWWQSRQLSEVARKAHCHVLYVPGGRYSGNFRPFVTMSRNLLPFEWSELRRYRLSLIALRLLILRYSQTGTFRNCDGLMFLTEYARKTVIEVTGQVSGNTVTVPHGISSRFRIDPKQARPISSYNIEKPFRILYVSIINQYKHQWHVVEGVGRLRNKGYPVSLHLVGPAHGPSLAKLNQAISAYDPEQSWVQYHGEVPYEDLHGIYENADLGLFASSCENMPNILLETMAAGLPLACSNRGPMPEILGNTGLYFNPENPVDIGLAVGRLIDNPELRQELSQLSFLRCEQYSWERCAAQTFKFLASVTREAQH